MKNNVVFIRRDFQSAVQWTKEAFEEARLLRHVKDFVPRYQPGLLERFFVPLDYGLKVAPDNHRAVLYVADLLVLALEGHVLQRQCCCATRTPDPRTPPSAMKL